MRTRLQFGFAVVLVICAMTTVPALAAAASGRTKVTTIAFSGAASAPTVTIHGSGFGKKPAASPTGPPYSYLPGCTSQAPIGNKNDGHDYGAQALWIGWGHVQAGGYVKGTGGYLDCIGLIVTKYTPSEIVFSLGCQYGYYAKLLSGTAVTISIAGHRFAAKVRYP